MAKVRYGCHRAVFSRRFSTRFGRRSGTFVSINRKLTKKLSIDVKQMKFYRRHFNFFDGCRPRRRLLTRLIDESRLHRHRASPILPRCDGGRFAGHDPSCLPPERQGEGAQVHRRGLRRRELALRGRPQLTAAGALVPHRRPPAFSDSWFRVFAAREGGQASARLGTPSAGLV